MLLVLNVNKLLFITFGNCSPIKLNTEFKLLGKDDEDDDVFVVYVVLAVGCFEEFEFP